MTDKYCLLPLSINGEAKYFTKISLEDYSVASLFRWTYTNGYACRKKPGNKAQSLHRFLLNPGASQYIDHINGDGLDNRRSNLRMCTQQENLRNKKASKSNKSGYKGVSFFGHGKRVKRWVAKINIGNKQRHIGYFASSKEAAIAYNNVARALFGEFARINSL